MNNQGRFYIENGKLIGEFENERSPLIKIADISGVGELTFEGNPVLDDYFLVIICKDKKHYEISFSEEGVSEIYKELQSVFSFKPDNGLANSVTFKSIGIYPLSIKNKPLFNIGLEDELILREDILKDLNF